MNKIINHFIFSFFSSIFIYLIFLIDRKQINMNKIYRFSKFRKQNLIVPI